MIEATEGVRKAGANQVAALEARMQPTADAEARRREPLPTETGASEVVTASKTQEAPPANPAFNVELDPETMRLYAEVRDPETDRVLMRIPDGYVTAAEREQTSGGGADMVV